MVAGGIYLLALSLAPYYWQYIPVSSEIPAVNTTGESAADAGTDYALSIPSINAAMPIGDSESALLDGMWHRYANRSNIRDGGNIVLAGHRFQLGWTPQQTMRRSPLYHADKVKVGEQIILTSGGRDYPFRASRIYSVEPQDTWIEADSQQTKLTIYTCELGGSADGRLVIEALPAS